MHNLSIFIKERLFAFISIPILGWLRFLDLKQHRICFSFQNPLVEFDDFLIFKLPDYLTEILDKCPVVRHG
jgi:hypothetical protein